MKDRLRSLGMAVALATGGIAVPAFVDASASKCVTSTHGVELQPGKTYHLKAEKMIITGDVAVNGKPDYDELADTGTVSVFDSEVCKTWTVKTLPNAGASLTYVADKTTDAQFDLLVGAKMREEANQDVNKSNPNFAELVKRHN